jgi:hypothetical protein
LQHFLLMADSKSIEAGGSFYKTRLSVVAANRNPARAGVIESRMGLV